MNEIQTLEAACHRFLSDPRDDLARAFLLEALANYKAIPSRQFPCCRSRLGQDVP